MDIALIIESLVPAAEYGGSTNENNEACFDALNWLDERPKPTWQECLDEWAIQTKMALFAHLANYRYNKEVGGIIINGMPVATDDRTKTLLVGAYNDALYENNPTRERQFKIGGNFITLTNADIIGIALTIAQHVQKCFDSESTVANMIDQNQLTTTSEVEDAFDTAYAG